MTLRLNEDDLKKAIVAWLAGSSIYVGPADDITFDVQDEDGDQIEWHEVSAICPIPGDTANDL